MSTEENKLAMYHFESLARSIYPDVQLYFQSEQGRKEYEAWKAKREQDDAKEKRD